MTQQVFVIHGGDAFDSHEEYIQSLRDTVVSLEPKVDSWKGNLQEDLGDGYEVYSPRFPNSQNARYSEWKIMFEKYLPLLSPDSIFIGHSLGGIFLAKYMEENGVLPSTKAIFLLAAPFATTEENPIVDFTLEKPFSEVGITGKNVFLYQSHDDMVVPFENVEQFRHALPDAELHEFTDKGHFNMEHFPELVEHIKSLS